MQPDDRPTPNIGDNTPRHQVFADDVPSMGTLFSPKFDVGVVFLADVPHPVI